MLLKNVFLMLLFLYFSTFLLPNGIVMLMCTRRCRTSCKNAVKLITSFECVLTELNDPPEA